MGMTPVRSDNLPNSLCASWEIHLSLFHNSKWKQITCNSDAQGSVVVSQKGSQHSQGGAVIQPGTAQGQWPESRGPITVPAVTLSKYLGSSFLGYQTKELD